MTESTLHTVHCAPRRATRFSLLDWLLTLPQLRRSREDLSHLDSRMLEDIGITQAQADTEVRKPIWDVPQHWLK